MKITTTVSEGESEMKNQGGSVSRRPAKKPRKLGAVERKIWAFVLAEAEKAIAQAEKDSKLYMKRREFIAAMCAAARAEYASKHWRNARDILSGHWTPVYDEVAQ